MTSYGLQVSAPSLFSAQFRGSPFNIAFKASGVRESTAVASSRSNFIRGPPKHVDVRAIWGSLRELVRIHTRHEFQGVLVINLLQNFIGQIQPVKPPERVAAAIIFDVIVARFHDAEIVSVLARLIDV